jgi:hypothetical protein
VQQLTGVRSDIDELALKLDEATADCTAKEQKTTAYESEHDVSALQQSLSSWRTEEQSSAKKKKMKASMTVAGEQGTSVVDLTLSSDDEADGDVADAKSKADAGVAPRDRDIAPGGLVDAGAEGLEGGSSAAAAAGSVAAGRGREEVVDDDGGSAKRAKC